MRRNPESGFTLLEAMVAALILLIAIIFVAQLFVTAMQQNRTSRQYTHATAIAQSKLEELNAIPIEKLAYGGELGGKDDGGGGGSTGGEGGSRANAPATARASRLGMASSCCGVGHHAGAGGSSRGTADAVTAGGGRTRRTS